jgi:hypothetical protein
LCSHVKVDLCVNCTPTCTSNCSSSHSPFSISPCSASCPSVNDGLMQCQAIPVKDSFYLLSLQSVNQWFNVSSIISSDYLSFILSNSCTVGISYEVTFVISQCIDFYYSNIGPIAICISIVVSYTTLSIVRTISAPYVGTICASLHTNNRLTATIT